jgi:hypothetical protein
MSCSRPADRHGSGGFSDALPTREPAREPAHSAVVPVFKDYLSPKLLRKRREERAGCREAWAFALSGALQCATWLGYDRGGLLFDNEHMSVEYLLTCYEEGSSAMCGCYGADLPSAMRAVAEHGAVTFRQFPFVASTSLSRDVFSRREGTLYCQERSHLDTCPPCGAAEDYVVTMLSASADRGSYRPLVHCLPCEMPRGPRYFFDAPFRIGGSDLVASIQSELRRFGPLPASLGLDAEAFGALRRGGEDFVVADTDEGVFYRPRSMAADVFQAVLIVGYNTSPESSYWILRSSHGAGPLGYSLAAGGDVVDGLFNLSFADGEALVHRVLSARSVLVSLDGGGTKALGAGDPFVFPKPAAALAAALLRREQKPPPAKSVWWGVVVAVTLVMLGVLAIVTGCLIIQTPLNSQY